MPASSAARMNAVLASAGDILPCNASTHVLTASRYSSPSSMGQDSARVFATSNSDLTSLYFSEPLITSISGANAPDSCQFITLELLTVNTLVTVQEPCR